MLTDNTGPRRDPRRLFTEAQRRRIADRQQWMCGGVCGGELPEPYHVHHVIPWAKGGLTDEDNGLAVCPACHLGAEVRELPEFAPREWQKLALPKVLPLLRRREFATVSAAPGAGKTKFTLWAIRQLLDADIVGRVVVFVPTANLRTQWADEAKAMNVFLGVKGTSHTPSYDGVVLTYAALNDARQVDQIADDAAKMPTLFVLDEVHHLAKDASSGAAGSWAVNIGRIVGTVQHPRHATLNLSGTLFRSRPEERISTICYEPADGNPLQVQTVADYVVRSAELIERKELRHIKVLGFDAEMLASEAIDLSKIVQPGAETIRAVDLDGDKKLRVPVLSAMIRDERYLDGIIKETVTRLGHASAVLQGHPVKGLVIADDIEHAEQVHDRLAAIIGRRHSFIAHGKLSSPDAEIERFRKSAEQGVMVGIQKFTEGFDAPDVCVVTYLRTWKASLFINQLTARAMRITRRELELGEILPATIIVPNETQIKRAFADVLEGPMGLLDLPPDPCGRCGREVCACPPWPKAKQCSRCGMPWMLCTCQCRKCAASRASGGCDCNPRNVGGQPDLGIQVVSDGHIGDVSVDGDLVDMSVLNMTRAQLAAFGISEVYAEQMAAGVCEAMRKDPFAFLEFMKESN